ncbi:hypothetical protein RBB50_006187 [Rhinocladiella similis]
MAQANSTDQLKPKDSAHCIDDSKHNGISHIRSTRVTDKYVLFWNGPLSNWNIGQSFSGRRAMDLLIERLDDLEITHPSRTGLSTQLMIRHDFVCGEQFMMACKGWLFETATIKGADLDTSHMTHDTIERICKAVRDGSHRGQGRGRGRGQGHGHGNGQRQRRVPAHGCSQGQRTLKNNSGNNNKTSVKGRPEGGDVDSDIEIEIDFDFDALAGGTLTSCIITPDPRVQKELGRRTRGFDERVWKRASKAVVVAGSIARAEADEELRSVYLELGPGRNFVEGSPVDKVWGIRLRWDDPRAEDESNWRGENRLGKCHDEAAGWIRRVHKNT